MLQQGTKIGKKKKKKSYIYAIFTLITVITSPLMPVTYITGNYYRKAGYLGFNVYKNTPVAHRGLLKACVQVILCKAF